ncbi:MAG: ring-cleaving dioxygenase [Firmicutes bacterium]|nr:ring-cleaving dioxygenase [Bacillota bacterium]
MKRQSAGIHHITAFAGNPQANVDFYAGILGLRMIKRTVNFDAPEIYHLYFGNEAGSPGTAMTFFLSNDNQRGEVGAGQVGFTTFAVPAGSLPFWEQRFAKFGIPFERSERFGETYLRFRDWDGLQLELVERDDIPNSNWTFGGVPSEHAIKGFGGAVLFSLKPENTMVALEELLGFERIGEDREYVRFRSLGEYGNIVDVYTGAKDRGSGGAGTIHHIAWRTRDEEEQSDWRVAVEDYGFRPTPVIDRQYFRSIYFREAGGILYEIATDGPGFTIDEPLEGLGGELVLPPQYEQMRERIEAGLEPIQVRVLEQDR